jgi:hypothetical protein
MDCPREEIVEEMESLIVRIRDAFERLEAIVARIKEAHTPQDLERSVIIPASP